LLLNEGTRVGDDAGHRIDPFLEFLDEGTIEGLVLVAAGLTDERLPLLEGFLDRGESRHGGKGLLLLLLRGDKAKEDSRFVPTPGGHAHTTELMKQVKRFNEGYFADGTPIKNPGRAFDYGVACYPEKHEEAPNMEMDMQYLKEKQELGAQYAVTQLFFDNEKYFQFVEKAQAMGITIPIIPGIKPMAKLSQLTVVPKTFHCDIPEPLAREVVKCKSDEDARQLGIEWTTQQCRELYQHGVQNIHFYTVSAVDSVVEVVKKL
jgi:methylenetetrahydrofolate reductase (NADPH)